MFPGTLCPFTQEFIQPGEAMKFSLKKYKNLIFIYSVTQFSHTGHFHLISFCCQLLFLNPSCWNLPFPVHCCGCTSLFWTKLPDPQPVRALLAARGAKLRASKRRDEWIIPWVSSNGSSLRPLLEIELGFEVEPLLRAIAEGPLLHQAVILWEKRS